MSLHPDPKEPESSSSPDADLASQIAARESQLREELARARAEEQQLEEHLSRQRDKVAASHASRLLEFQNETKNKMKMNGSTTLLEEATTTSPCPSPPPGDQPQPLLLVREDIGLSEVDSDETFEHRGIIGPFRHPPLGSSSIDPFLNSPQQSTSTSSISTSSTAIPIGPGESFPSSSLRDHSMSMSSNDSESEDGESGDTSSSAIFSIPFVRGTRKANDTVISLSSSDGEDEGGVRVSSDGDGDGDVGGSRELEEEEGESDVVRKDHEDEDSGAAASGDGGFLGGLRRLFGWIGRRRQSESEPPDSGSAGKPKIRVPDPAERLELENPSPHPRTGPSARQSVVIDTYAEPETPTHHTGGGGGGGGGRKKRTTTRQHRPRPRSSHRRRKGGFLGSSGGLSSRDFREALRESGATSVILETSSFSDWKKNSLMTWAETIGVEGLPEKIEQLDIRTHLDLLRVMIRRDTAAGIGSEHEMFFDGISQVGKIKTLLNFHLVHRNDRFDSAYVRIIDKLAEKPGFASTRIEDTTMFLDTILLPSELRKMIVSTFESERRPVPVKVVAVNHDVLSKLGLHDSMQIALHRREMGNYLSGPISTAIVVGKMLIDWNQSGICCMKAISTADSGFFLSVAEGLLPCLLNMEQEAALGLLEATNDDPRQAFQDRLERLGSVIVRFNKEEVYDQKQNNAQHFVAEALMAMALTTGMHLTCEGVMSLVLSDGFVSHLPFELKRVRDWSIQDLLMWFEVIALRKTFTTIFEFDLDATRMFHSDLDRLAKHLICKTRGSSVDRVFFRLQYYCLLKFFECEVLVKRDHVPVLKKLHEKVQADKVMKKSDCYTVPCMVFPPIAKERFFGDRIDRLDVKIILLEDAVDFGKGSVIRFTKEKLLNMHPALLVNDSVLMDWVCPGIAIPRQVIWRIQLPQLELFSIRSIPVGQGDATGLLEKLLEALAKWNITMRFGDPAEFAECGNPMTFIEDILREIGIADFVEAVGDSGLLQKLRRDGRVAPLRFEPGPEFCGAFGLDTDREFQFASHVALDSFVLSLASETSKNLQQFPMEYKVLRIIDRVFWFRKMWDTARSLTDEATLFHPMTEEREGEQPEVCLCPFSHPFESE